MSWRIVVVHNTAKLDLRLQYLVVRSEMKTQKIHISEIALLLVESTSVSLTVGLLAELTRQKVKVIFCDQKRNPSSELVSYYGSHDTSNKVRTQISWSPKVKEAVWTEIVREKINQQAEHLLERGKNKEAGLLREYVQQMQWNDATNREGHAAKVYFNALFGMDFSRSQDCPINAALNYGYSLILSAVNREIVTNGYLTQLGLFHDNMFNQFNLGSDLMEPFRVLIDRKVFDMTLIEFEHEEKMQLVNLLNEEVIMDGKHYVILNAIGVRI
ncbi:cRISPR-associated endonuclease Cas1 [Roseburia sp. CAG:380]|nr:cRISPR-associated endonuclease Cas1 [Roseburia sp. CAG:380]